MGGGEESDGLVVVRCQLGERAVFGALVGRWHEPLWRFVRGMVGPPDLADDLAQEVWVAVVRGLPGLREPERFAAWLFTVARRTVTDHLRRTYRAPETRVEEPEDSADADSGDGLGDLLTVMEIRAGLSGLPPLEREVLILFHLQDLTLATCADVLGVPPGTVKSRLHRARRLLRTTLVERGYEA
ncbi:RNA polymerase sigma factor [Kitasatospora camelliae]|uniref:Sigma-70 family RNA polymerase sigma factor n=1 Tax=Kitasatospora camelliae TaxID=3156397 RepID=A0AAU8JSQ1_9ACTN